MKAFSPCALKGARRHRFDAIYSLRVAYKVFTNKVAKNTVPLELNHVELNPQGGIFFLAPARGSNPAGP